MEWTRVRSYSYGCFFYRVACMIALKECVIRMSTLRSSWQLWAASGNWDVVLCKLCVVHSSHVGDCTYWHHVVFLAVFLTASVRGAGNITWSSVELRIALAWSIDRFSMCSWCLCCCGLSRVGFQTVSYELHNRQEESGYDGQVGRFWNENSVLDTDHFGSGLLGGYWEAFKTMHDVVQELDMISGVHWRINKPGCLET